MKTKSSPVSSKQNKTQRNKIVHLSAITHKKLKIFCATLDLDLGHTAEKAITDYITRNS